MIKSGVDSLTIYDYEASFNISTQANTPSVEITSEIRGYAYTGNFDNEEKPVDIN